MATERKIKNPYSNPYSNFNFGVEFDGEEVAAFSEVSGLDSENTPIDYREGADSTNAQRKLPGIEAYTAVQLKRGISGNLDLWKWREEVRDGGSAFPLSRVVTIKLYDEKNDHSKDAVMTWKLTNAWPSKLTGPSLTAKGNDIAIEQLDLVHDRIDIV